MPRWKKEGSGAAVLLLAGVVGLLLVAIWLYRSQKPAPHNPQNAKTTRIGNPLPLRIASNHPELRDISPLEGLIGELA